MLGTCKTIKHNDEKISLMHSISQEMVLYINVLGKIMKHLTLQEPNKTWIVTIHNNEIQHMISQICNQLAKKDCPTTCQ
jgi:hypothetical protein